MELNQIIETLIEEAKTNGFPCTEFEENRITFKNRNGEEAVLTMEVNFKKENVALDDKGTMTVKGQLTFKLDAESDRIFTEISKFIEEITGHSIAINYIQ